MIKKAIFGILLLSSIGLYQNIYAGSNKYLKPVGSAEYDSVKDFVTNNIQKLLPYPAQITVRRVSIDESGNISVSDILVINDNDEDLNLSISKLTLKGLDIDGRVTKNFSIDFEGVSFTNLAAILSKHISKFSGTNSLTRDTVINSGLWGVILNNLGQGVYNFDIDYNYAKKAIDVNVKSKNNKRKFIYAKASFDNASLNKTAVKNISLNISKALENSNLGNAYLSASFSELIKQIFRQYVNDTSKHATLNINASFEKKTRDLKINTDGVYNDKKYINYNSIIKNVGFADVKVKDLIVNYADALSNAYVYKADSLFDLDFNLEAKDFPKNSEIQYVFKAVNKKDINISIKSQRKYSSSKYVGRLDISSPGLIQLMADLRSKVDGNLALLPYLGIESTNKKSDLYDCKDKLCISSFEVNLLNGGLLEQIAKMTSSDPNTSGKQVLASYGALLQLLATQQQDSFSRKLLSSIAMFLQKPENFEIKALAKKPVNQNAMIGLLIKDIINLKENNSISPGKVSISNKTKLNVLGDMDKLFNISFNVDR